LCGREFGVGTSSSTALAKVDDSNLSDEVELFGGHKGTRVFALIVLTSD
jgi:hypothetical protein